MNTTSVQNYDEETITVNLSAVETPEEPRKFCLLYSNHTIDFYCL